MADKNYRLTFQLSDGSEKSVDFTAPQGPQGIAGAVGIHVGPDAPEDVSVKVWIDTDENDEDDGDAGTGGGAAFYVTLSYDSENAKWTADKTAEELTAAYEARNAMFCILPQNGTPMVLPLLSYDIFFNFGAAVNYTEFISVFIFGNGSVSVSTQSIGGSGGDCVYTIELTTDDWDGAATLRYISTVSYDDFAEHWYNGGLLEIRLTVDGAGVVSFTPLFTMFTEDEGVNVFFIRVFNANGEVSMLAFNNGTWTPPTA